ncbi:CNP1-like family protein [Crenobacter luteus]|uniref:CNP1-like uncharacterized domain-containing protein n=1 Tax=Crenobacter luteus TaxID=1452487 RepID=A0A163B799_9NEIS|nr:CNP1-like family protein [Crenobacter luteus]KZE24931.1 hypothetical protein AVW16_03690 [Crenobacter luteus]
MTTRKTWLIAAALAGLALTAHAETRRGYNSNYAFDVDKPWVESGYALPTYPKTGDWLPFFVHRDYPNKSAVDAGTLTVGDDGVVRYVLRVESPSGAKNDSVEGLRCQTRELKRYAFGDTINGRWIESLKPAWGKIELDDRLHRALHAIVCPDNWVPKSAAEAVAQLKKAAD